MLMKGNIGYSLARTLVYSMLGVVSMQAQTEVKNRGSEEMRRGYELAQSYERSGDWATAERVWRQVLTSQSDDAHAWTNLGVVLNRQNKTAEAIDAWTRATQINPTLSGAYLNIGLTYFRIKRYPDAATNLRHVLGLEPENVQAR